MVRERHVGERCHRLLHLRLRLRHDRGRFPLRPVSHDHPGSQQGQIRRHPPCRRGDVRLLRQGFIDRECRHQNRHEQPDDYRQGLSRDGDRPAGGEYRRQPLRHLRRHASRASHTESRGDGGVRWNQVCECGSVDPHGRQRILERRSRNPSIERFRHLHVEPQHGRFEFVGRHPSHCVFEERGEP